MHRSGKFRPALVAGWICSALLASPYALADAAPDDPAQLLKHADAIKSANHGEFVETLGRLDAESVRLSPAQQMYLRYLKAWQSAYFGDYVAAIPQLNAIIAQSTDSTLRFRAGVTAVNILSISSRNEEAYERLSQLLDSMPQVTDPDARLQGIGVAAQLYNQAGQYDLSLSYTDRLIATAANDTTACKGLQLRINSLYKSGRLSLSDSVIPESINVCAKVNEPIFIELIHVDVAKLDIAQGHPSDAIKLLTDNYDKTLNTHYPPLISTVDAILASAYWKNGDTQQARQYALHAIESGIKKEYTEAQANAYDVLYEVAKQQGDAATALDWHEKYATAAKGYLNDVSARSLAYQMVKQQVQEKKLQIDALNKKNQVLQLRQEVTAKDALTGRLWIALLLVVLGSIGLYAYRTKRSQMKFQKLAQRDGLTGIYNRQHFVEESEQTLNYGAKSVRDASVIVIDLDHFKQINDEHGHAAGDMVLRRVVAACQMQLRSIDVFGRLGGEEFGILMPDCVPERAADLAEQMRLAIDGMSGFEDGPDFPVNASFGISAARWSGYNLRQLLAHADSALYQAKRDGRNRVVVYDHVAGAGKNLPPGMVDRRKG